MKVLAIVFSICALILATALGQDYKPGQLYVVFKPNRATLYRDSNGSILCSINYIDSINQANNYSAFISAGCDACQIMQNDYLVVFPESTDVPALAEAYMADTNVQWAGPNALFSAAFTPNDPYFSRPSPTATPSSYQWPFDSSHLQMEKAWDITKGNPNVVIAVMEFALAWRHPRTGPGVV